MMKPKSMTTEARPNKRLKLPGRLQVRKNCFHSQASSPFCSTAALRQRALRPQLKRDPLGRSTHMTETLKW
jgi:hypothetical protein